MATQLITVLHVEDEGIAQRCVAFFLSTIVGRTFDIQCALSEDDGIARFERGDIGLEPLPVANASPTEQKLETLPINQKDLLTRCLGNYEFALALLDELESSSSKRLEAIHLAAQQQETQATAEEAHSLKGVAGILCANSVQHAAAQVEAAARAGNLAEIRLQVDNLTRELRHCLESLPTLRQEIQIQQQQASQT